MSSDRIDQSAAAWFARLLAPDCSERDREDFEAWCAASDDHAAAFAAVADCHFAAAELKDDLRVRAATRAARHSAGSSGRRFLPARAPWLAAAAVLMLAVAAGSWWMIGGRKIEPVRYATAVGERRAVELADGTRLQLDTDTEVRAAFGPASRELTLERGRVRIDVAQDAQRPLSVRSGPGVVHDIGTQFQVERRDGGVTVTLFSGLVSVALAEPAAAAENVVLAPGETLRLDDRGRFGRPEPVDLDAASDWTRGVLAFKERRLADLLEEMNRYSETKIRVDDPELSTLLVSGVFRVDDQASLLQALQTGWSLRAQRVSEHEIVLSRTR
ncbi:FecR domain-containing protein [Dokdonella sp.]|uniref:FecR family protein n=1 Tax=Dokdonella sp. TaxID=2291710 RepID=UPI001B0FA604|nr:FecR domain-containing protein [Dokdonella sp.]MBO9664576.1 FecR domain-containing protein [Dokdonella sp.]